MIFLCGLKGIGYFPFQEEKYDRPLLLKKTADLI